MKEVDGDATENVCKDLCISSSNFWVRMYRDLVNSTTKEEWKNLIKQKQQKETE